MTGKSEPTEDELEGFEAPDASDPRLQNAGAKVAQGVPFFWLTVLCNQVKVLADSAGLNTLELKPTFSLQPVNLPNPICCTHLVSSGYTVNAGTWRTRSTT